MCTPSHACALTYKRRFWTCIRGNLPVTVKPDNIVPQLVNQHGFTSSHDIIKHKRRESYVGLPLLEECLGGRRSEPRRLGFRQRKTTRTSESSENLHVSLAYVCECGARLSDECGGGKVACMRSNLEAKVLDLCKGESPRYGETGPYSAPTCEPTWFHIIP